MLEIGKNNHLTAEEKSSQYLAAEQLLPHKEQKFKQAERTRATLKSNIEAAKEAGASDELIFQMRAEVHGYEAAERFALADKKKEEWETRFEHYRLEKQQIIENEGLSDFDRKDEISFLQRSLFNQKEQKRLATLDKLADKKVQL